MTEHNEGLGVVCRGRCVVDRCSICRGCVGLSLTRVATSRGRGVDGLARVGNLSDVASQVVGVVSDGLDPAVGKVDGVRSSHGTGAIVGLGLLEVGLGVVVGHGVGVGVGGGLSKVGGSNGVHHGGVLGGGGGGSHKGKGDEGLKDKNENSNTSKIHTNKIYGRHFEIV